METAGLRRLGLHTLGDTRAAVAHRPQRSTPGHLPFLQPASNDTGNTGGSVPVSRPRNGDRREPRAHCRGLGAKVGGRALHVTHTQTDTDTQTDTQTQSSRWSVTWCSTLSAASGTVWAPAVPSAQWMNSGAHSP